MTSALRYRKDCARVGQFTAYNPSNGKPVQLEITPTRLAKWVRAFENFTDAGNLVDLTANHEPRGAHSVYGRVLSLFRARAVGDALVLDDDGDRLGADVAFADAEARAVGLRCDSLSIEVEEDFLDGLGNHYPEAITAVTICRQPVVNGQLQFRELESARVAASRSLRREFAGETRDTSAAAMAAATDDMISRHRF